MYDESNKIVKEKIRKHEKNSKKLKKFNKITKYPNFSFLFLMGDYDFFGEYE